MATQTITITHGDPITGDLILDIPNLEAETSDKVEWIIKSGSGVSSLVEILDKSGYKNVWRIRPKKDNSWKGKIKGKTYLPNRYVYKYSIRWKAGNNTPPLDHDPIISINPSKRTSKFFLVIGLVTTFFLSLFSISLFLRQKKNGK